MTLPSLVSLKQKKFMGYNRHIYYLYLQEVYDCGIAELQNNITCIVVDAWNGALCGSDCATKTITHYRTEGQKKPLGEEVCAPRQYR
jgi:hypothetical protein